VAAALGGHVPDSPDSNLTASTGGMVASLSSHADQPAPPPAPPPPRGPAAHPEIVRHAAATFNARVTKVVQKKRPSG